MPFLPVYLEVHDASRCAESTADLLSKSPTTIKVQDDSLVMPARCESLIAIRSQDSRSVMRRHRDVQLREMGSYVRSGCIPPILGKGGAITATRFPHRFILLDSYIPPPRPQHKERVSAHHELAILQLPSSCFPFMSSQLSSLNVSFLCPFTIRVFLPLWVFLCLSLLEPTSVQGPSTRRGVWFALSCLDEASRPVLCMPERLLIMLRIARPL